MKNWLVTIRTDSGDYKTKVTGYYLGSAYEQTLLLMSREEIESGLIICIVISE